MPADPAAPALALMAKRPLAGQSKSRLMPDLSASGAAEVAALLIRETAHLACEAWPGPIYLFCWPNQDDPVFREIAVKSRIRTRTQSAGTLGDKMSSAICDFTDQGTPTAVMGCDIPHCPPDQLLRAYRWLQEGKNVIGPGVDGGYYLLGLQACHPGLFSGIRWGGADVLRDTLKRASELDIELSTMDLMQDIDDYEDLLAAAADIPGLRLWIK